MSAIISVQELIHVLPFEKEFKKYLVDNYPDKMDESERYVVQSMIWEIHDRYFAILLAKNKGEMLADVASGDLEGTTDLMLRARQKTEDEILGWITTKVDAQELDKIRDNMKPLPEAQV